MEFIMKTDLGTALPQTIDFNFEELRQELEASLEHYNHLVVTEGGIRDAKADRARLSKLREAVEDKRKEVKRNCMAPYTAFEAKVKELVGLIDQPIAAIDGQLKGYEQQRRDAKHAEVAAFFGEAVGDLFDILTLSALWKDEWYNTTYSLKKIKEELSARIEKTRADLAVLDTVEGEFKEPVKLVYLDTLDVSAALAERARLQTEAERLREYEAQRQKRMQEEAVEAARSAATAAPPVGADCGGEAQGGACKNLQEGEKTYRLAFECPAITVAQARDLKAFLDGAGISYRRL